MENVNANYGRRLADVAIRQSAASGNIMRLDSSLKDALALKLAPIEADLEYFKDFGLKNQQILTEQEQARLNAIVAEKDKMIAQTKTEQATLSTAIKTALDNGIKIPDSVIQQMQENPGNAYQILASNGITLQNPLERELKIAQIGSANRANQPSGSTGGGALSKLPVSIQGKVISAAEKFGTSDITKKYVSTVDSINTVNGIDSTSTNPADHQAIVYAFAKALDPDSAVKEGEYETIKKYAQSAVKRYGREISNAVNGTGFLSKEAIENIQTTMNNLEKSRKPQFDKLYSERARTINNIAGADVAGEVLIDYSPASSVETAKTEGNGQTVKVSGADWVVGKLYADDNGMRGTFDIKGNWIPQ